MCFFDGHIRELGPINSSNFNRLLQKVLASEALWPLENERKPNKFDCFTETEHIIFKFPDQLDSHLNSSYRPLWSDWEAVVQPVIDEATAGYRYAHGQTARIMLARLLPKGSIGKHIDQNASAEVPHKIHVPIVTNDQITFVEEDTEYHLEACTAYEVNNRIPHAVTNGSNQPRVHLIFDYYDQAE